MSEQRWHRKADALYRAWVAVVHSYPSLSAVELSLAVAQHETLCGDAWPGEHNWGAVQKRALLPAERAVLTEAGIVFEKRDNAQLARASELIHASAAAGRISPIAGEALHYDSSPDTGLYVVWFHAFPNDFEGAKGFLRELVIRRPECRAILEGPLPVAAELASAMYKSKYYEGFSQDPGKNIADYLAALRKQLPPIVSALRSWVAPQTDIPNEMVRDLSTVVGQKRALNYLGFGRPELPETSTKDTKFAAVVGFFQGASDLVVDGACGPKTQETLAEALELFEEMKPKK